jgi:hypothetical protein
MQKIEQKRSEGFDARILAGYCWDWNSHNSKDGTDFSLDGIGEQRWNTDYSWANNSKMADEIGCVHTGQGMEFQYAGVIIGKDKGVKISIPKMTKDGKLQLIEEDKAESSFVPICTKLVFMKYYSAIMSDANYWTKEIDAEGYLNDIKECLNKLKF